MSRSILFLALLGWLAAGTTACKSAGQSPEPHEDQSSADHADGEEGLADDGLLRVERNMLRDLRITTQPAVSRPAGDVITVLGELRVNEDAYAEIGTSIPARVARVLAGPGDLVEAGQALVELESPEIGVARGARLSSRARLALATQTAERRRGLAADQIVPQHEIQAAEAELTQADADYAAARQSLAALGASRGLGSRFLLTSPIAGTVIDRTALRGRVVDAGNALFVVGDLSRLWLVVHAFERDALRIRPRSTARVTFAALPGGTTDGPVTLIGSRVDPTSRTIDVRIEVDNPSGVLRPGMSATALVPIGDDDERVVTVPVEAVQRQPAGWCVFVPHEGEGVFEVRVVGRGRDLGGDVELVSGLRAGERVVVEGAFLLKAEADKARGGGGEE